MVPEIALAASAREWPDRLHRYLLDHGGGRVSARLMGPDQAFEATFDVLLIDDVCSFLSPRLVSVLKDRGSDVVGVFASDDGSDAKRRLLECGISDVIEMEAPPSEFLDKISSTMTHRDEVSSQDQQKTAPLVCVGVTGATDGVGATEVSATLATALSQTLRPVLFDLDVLWPSIAQRLDLPLHPNLRTVLDAAMHNAERVPESVMSVGNLSVVGGVADAGRGSPVHRVEVSAMYDILAPDFDVAVSDLGPHDRSIRGLGRAIETLVVVGSAEPVGVARLLKTLDSVVEVDHQTQVLAVVNKTPRRRFFESEIRREISKAHPHIPVMALPFDLRIQRASWEGRVMTSGAFYKSIRRMARLISESVVA